MTPSDLEMVTGLVGISVDKIDKNIKCLLLQTPTTKAEVRLQNHFLAVEMERALRDVGLTV